MLPCIWCESCSGVTRNIYTAAQWWKVNFYFKCDFFSPPIPPFFLKFVFPISHWGFSEKILFYFFYFVNLLWCSFNAERTSSHSLACFPLNCCSFPPTPLTNLITITKEFTIKQFAKWCEGNRTDPIVRGLQLLSTRSHSMKMYML